MLKYLRLSLYLSLLFLLLTTCDLFDNSEPKPVPPGYQYDIPWPSLADSPWPMFQGNPQNSGRSNFRGPINGKIKWEIELTFGVAPYFITINDKDEILSSWSSIKPDSIASTSDYLIYFSTLGEILRYNDLCSTGLNQQDEISASLTTNTGITYTASACGILYAFDSDSTVLWEYDAGEAIYNGLGGINIDKLGNIYFSTISKFYSMDQNANIRWSNSKYKRQKAVFSADGSTFYIKSESTIDAVDLNGNVNWSFTIKEGDYLLFIICDAQSNIYFANDSIFFSVTPSGTIRWEFQPDSLDDMNYGISPTIDIYGNLYFSTSNYLYSLSYDGKLRWKLSGLGNGGTHLVTDMVGDIFVSNEQDGILYSISNAGNINWSLNIGTNTNISCAPAIGNDSTLYIITENPTTTSSTIYSIN